MFAKYAKLDDRDYYRISFDGKIGDGGGVLYTDRYVPSNETDAVYHFQVLYRHKPSYIIESYSHWSYC